MTLPTMRSGTVSREFLRIAGGYGAPAAGASPAGGLDVDNAGHLATDGDVTVKGVIAAGSTPQAITNAAGEMDGARIQSGTVDTTQLADDAVDATKLDETDDYTINGLTVSGNVTVDGDFKMDTNGTNKTWSQYFGAAHVYNMGTGALTLVTFQGGDIYAPVLDFDKDGSEGVCLNVGLPEDYDGSALKFTIYWTATAGTSGTVAWNIVMRVFDHDEPLAQVSTGFHVADTFIAQNDVHRHEVTYTPDGAAAGDLLTLYLRRIGGSDTFDADARFIGIRISYA